MSDREFLNDPDFLDDRSKGLRDREGRSPVVGRSIRLTTTPSKVMKVILAGNPVTDLPGGGIVLVAPFYMLYVFRQNGQPGMIINRVSPFQYEQMMFTDLEMETVMSWAHKMVIEGIGRFSPADGGWMWWRK